MKSLAAILILVSTIPIYAADFEPTLTATSAVQVIASLSNALPDLSAYTPQEPTTLAGKYSQEGFLAVWNLYLFSDHTYIFTEKGDVGPFHIFETGRWLYQDNTVSITSDGTISTDCVPPDRVFIPLMRGETKTYLLGAHWFYSFMLSLVEELGADKSFSICTYERKELYVGVDESVIKNDVIERFGTPKNQINSIQQGGPGYPPQGVGSPDP